MMKALKKVNWKKLGIFAGGVLFGTAGIKVLSSKDAKNVYTHCTAGVLRAKDCAMVIRLCAMCIRRRFFVSFKIENFKIFASFLCFVLY